VSPPSPEQQDVYLPWSLLPLLVLGP
jgi:hypothetical protein